MSFPKFTLQDSIDRVEANIESRLEGGKLPRRSPVKAIARALAVISHEHYQFMKNYVSLDTLPTTCSYSKLLEWKKAYELPDVNGDKATGDIDITGTDGNELTIGSKMKNASGVEFEVTVAGTISGGVATCTVEAVENGVDGNLVEGEKLTLESPVPGINTEVTVATGGFSGGSDDETEEELRARILLRMRKPPESGRASDYEQWALEAHSDVTRAFITNGENGAGTVTVRVVTDDLATPLPTAGIRTAVADYIETKRPITASVDVPELTEKTLNLTIGVTPDTSEVREAVEAELADLLKRDGEPGATLKISRIREAVSTAAGEEDSTVTVPAADVTHAAGEFPVLGTITWS